MDKSELARIVFYQLETFYFLQEFDHLRKIKDEAAISILTRIYQQRQVDPLSLQFANLISGLSILNFPLAIARNLNDEQLSKYDFPTDYDRYALIYRRNGMRQVPSGPSEVLRVVRNAVAHLPDFFNEDASPNITFDDGLIVFHSRKCDVIIETAEGYINFISDLTSAIKKIALDLMHDELD